MQTTKARFVMAAVLLVGLVASPTVAHSAQTDPPPAVSVAPVPRIDYVRWADPKEGAFTIEVPKGWKTQGGLVRAGTADVREGVISMAPDGSQLVIIGDATLPTFAPPPPYAQQNGGGEGSPVDIYGNFTLVYLHYMPALEFNRFYIEKGLSRVLNNLHIGEEQDHPEVARQIEAGSRVQGDIPIHDTFALTAFSGQDSKSGKKMVGAVLTLTQRLGDDPASGAWTARPIVILCADDENRAARFKATIDAGWHMLGSLQGNPTWQKKEKVQQDGAIGKATATANKQITDAQARIKAGDEAAQTDLITAYWKRGALRANGQIQRINHLETRKVAVTIGGGSPPPNK